MNWWNAPAKRAEPSTPVEVLKAAEARRQRQRVGTSVGFLAVVAIGLVIWLVPTLSPDPRGARVIVLAFVAGISTFLLAIPIFLRLAAEEDKRECELHAREEELERAEEALAKKDAVKKQPETTPPSPDQPDPQKLDPQVRASLAYDPPLGAEALPPLEAEGAAPEPVLAWVDLRNAPLRNADLRGADLRHSDLRGSDLRNARLGAAMLAGADLRDCQLEGASLAGVIFDASTRWPKSIDPTTLATIHMEKDD
jgi:hypothetical protein